MKSKAFLCLTVLLLCGCANSSKISGHSPSEFGREAEKIWQARLNEPLRGHPNKATIRSVRGTLAMLEIDGKYLPAKVGLAFSEEASLQTGDDTQVDLFLGDNGPALRLKENSSLRIVRLRVTVKSKTEKITDTMIELEKGNLVGNVKKLAAQSNYMIRTRHAIVQIRGTEFSVGAEGDVEITAGRAQVYALDKSFTVNPNEIFVPGKGVEKLR